MTTIQTRLRWFTVVMPAILALCGPAWLWADVDGRSAAASRLGSHLRDMLRERQATPSAEPSGLLRKMRNELQAGRMPVVLRLDAAGLSAEHLRSELAAIDTLQLHYLSSDLRWARATVGDAAALAALAAQPWLATADYAPPPILRRGAARSRAGVALRSEQLAASASVDGSGQTVGVISDSFAHTAGVRSENTTPSIGVAGSLVDSRPQNSGDLPAVVQILNDSSRDNNGNFSGSDEGAAMAELIYDVAPGAGLMFHTAGGSRREFADAIDTLCRGGATVVVDDVLFLTEASYQDDLPAIAARRCVQAGIPYLSAVGNDGDQGQRFVYRDSNAQIADPASRDAPIGNDLHNWSANGDDRFMAVTLPAFSQMYVLLNWNQPNASVNANRGAQVDLDLYSTTADEVAALDIDNPGFYGRGANVQGSTGAPFGDAVEYVLLETGARSVTYYLAVEHVAGSQGDIPQQPGVPLEFRLLYTGAVPLDIEYDFNAPSSWGHALAEGIAAVAAVAWWESPEYVPSFYTSVGIDPEPFTSRGGTQHLQFDDDGNYQLAERRPPHFAAVDGNNTTFLGSPSTSSAPEDGEPDDFPNFFGTSAAAPNAAGVFALLLEAFPGATPEQLIAAVRDSAIDVNGLRAEVGVDDVSGSGLLDASAAGLLLEQRLGSGGTGTGTGGSDGGGSSGSSGNSGSGAGSESDAKAPNDAGCFIATAAYGSFLAEDVELLRHFRDRVLLRFDLGRQFVQLYYHYSPPLADAIAERAWARGAVRAALLPLVLGIRYPLLSAATLLLLLAGLRYRLSRRPQKALNLV